jgi:hypothetical protein
LHPIADFKHPDPENMRIDTYLQAPPSIGGSIIPSPTPIKK